MSCRSCFAGSQPDHPQKEYYAIFSVAYKLVIGFAAVGIINAVFMQETFKVAASDDKLMMRQKAVGVTFIFFNHLLVENHDVCRRIGCNGIIISCP